MTQISQQPVISRTILGSPIQFLTVRVYFQLITLYRKQAREEMELYSTAWKVQVSMLNRFSLRVL